MRYPGTAQSEAGGSYIRLMRTTLVHGGIVEIASVAAIVAAGAALRFWTIELKPLWLDEAFSVWVAAHELPGLLEFVGTVDHHPPLYYVLLHAWQNVFGDGQGTVRVLSALLGVAAIPVFYWGGRLLVGRWPAWIAALLLAISPFHVRYGQEARMYALMVFLAAAMFLCLAVYLVDSRPASGRRLAAMIGMGCAQAALMLTHNTAAMFVPLALNAAVLGPYLWSGRRRVAALPALNEARFLRGWLTVQVIVFAVWLPWLPRFIHQAATVYEDFWIEPLTGYFVWLTFHNFNLAYPDGWFPGSPWWDFLYWGLAIVGLIALRRRGAVAFLLATLFLGPAVAEVVISLWRPILYDRTLAWTTLPYYLLIGAGVYCVAGAAGRAGGNSGRESVKRAYSFRYALAAVVLITLVVLSMFSLRAYYRDYHKENWPDAAAFVVQRTSPDDLVLFNAPWGEIPFAHYAGQETMQAAMRGAPADLFSRGELESRMRQDDLPRLRELVAPHDDVWLVYTHEWYTDPEGLIMQELERSYGLVEERSFNGPRVLHFRRSGAGSN
jgi:mannosyltransferase